MKQKKTLPTPLQPMVENTTMILFKLWHTTIAKTKISQPQQIIPSCTIRDEKPFVPNNFKSGGVEMAVRVVSVESHS